MKFSLTTSLLLITILALAAALIFVRQPDPTITVRLVDEWGELAFEVADTSIQGIPSWHGESECPISIDRAFSIAQQACEELDQITASEDVGGWTLISITLVSFDYNALESNELGKSCYCVKLYADQILPDNVGYSGPQLETHFLILMNGEFVVGRGGYFKPQTEIALKRIGQLLPIKELHSD